MKYRYGAALGLLAMAATAHAVEGRSYCERMAGQLAMKPVAHNGRAIGEWRVGIFSPVQRLLTGGSSMVSFAMRPAGDVSKAGVSDYLRLQSVCGQQKKDMLCRIDEPLILTVSAGKGKAEVESMPGEHAEVGTKGSQLFCRDPRAIKDH